MYSDLGRDWITWGSNLGKGKIFFSFKKSYTLTLGPTKPLNQWVTGFPSGGKNVGT